VVPTDGKQLGHLIHALETWKEFGPPLDHIIVVGEVAGLKSSAVVASATLWPVAQMQNQPRLNQQRMLSAVVGSGWPEDVTFIWSHDDIYLHRPFDLEELTGLSWCGMKKHPTIRTHSKVAQATRQTVEMLEAKGLPAVNYELHLPLVIQPKERRDWMDLMPRNDLMQFRTWVLNHLATRAPKLISDVKIFKDSEKLPALGIYSTGKNLAPRSLRRKART
jgi:hypothetical protein